MAGHTHIIAFLPQSSEDKDSEYPRKTDQRKDDPAKHIAKDQSHQVIVEEPDQSPIQGSNHDQE